MTATTPSAGPFRMLRRFAKALKFDEEGNETHTDFYRMLEIVYQSDFSGVISIEFEGHGMDPVAGSLKTKELILKGLAKARKA